MLTYIQSSITILLNEFAQHTFLNGHTLITSHQIARIKLTMADDFTGAKTKQNRIIENIIKKVTKIESQFQKKKVKRNENQKK